MEDETQQDIIITSGSNTNISIGSVYPTITLTGTGNLIDCSSGSYQHLTFSNICHSCYICNKDLPFTSNIYYTNSLEKHLNNLIIGDTTYNFCDKCFNQCVNEKFIKSKYEICKLCEDKIYDISEENIIHISGNTDYMNINNYYICDKCNIKLKDEIEFHKTMHL